MSAEAIARAFAADLPFVGLRDHEHDTDLDRVVPLDAARAARVLPLFADEERVRVAVADPAADLGALSSYLEGRRVELVVAAREELDVVLGPAPALAPTPEPPEAEPPDPEPLAAAEPPSPESAPAATSGSEEEVAGAEPPPAEQTPPASPAPAEPATTPASPEEPSWLQTPPRSRRRVVTMLLVLLLLLVVAGAVAAYLLTR